VTGRVMRWWWAAAVLAALCCAPALAQDDVPKRINAHLANEVIPLDSNASTVAGFIGELAITLPPDAVVEPPMESALTDGMSVFLHGLTVTRGRADEQIPVVMKVEPSFRFGNGGTELLDPGQTGLRRVTYTIFYYEGREVGRRLRETVLRPMRPMRVVYYEPLSDGDGPSIDQILKLRLTPGDHHTPPTRYRKTLTMSSTAYEPGPHSCGRFASGYTSAGYKAGYGVVAVDPNVIPMHTRLYIEGYGYAVAGDRGSAIRGKDIDLGFLTVDECYKWGRRQVEVYILY